MGTVISSCGTSLLTKGAPRELLEVLFRHANDEEGELPPKVRSEIDQRVQEVQGLLAEVAQAKRQSAEINGVVSLYGAEFGTLAHRDVHMLLCTDTYQGRACAQLVREWLLARGISASVVPLIGLTTRNVDAFNLGMQSLVTWLEEYVIPWREQGQRITFNLVGGFKSVQGVLNTLGMFYADEIVYIFDSPGAELIRIPRLPIRLDAAGFIEEHLNVFRKLHLRLQPAADEIRGMPEMLLDLGRDGTASLSVWGEMLFKRSQDTTYAQRLWPCPTSRIRFSPNFAASVHGIGPDRTSHVNHRVDDLVRYLTNGHNPPHLDFKRLKGNPAPPSTHECDAWADRGGYRIFLHFEDDGGTLVLDELGRGLGH